MSLFILQIKYHFSQCREALINILGFFDSYSFSVGLQNPLASSKVNKWQFSFENLFRNSIISGDK